MFLGVSTSLRVAGLALAGALACGGARVPLPTLAPHHADRQHFVAALDIVAQGAAAESAIVVRGGGSLLRSHATRLRPAARLHRFTTTEMCAVERHPPELRGDKRFRGLQGRAR
jgi:hypothetical protein